MVGLSGGAAIVVAGVALLAMSGMAQALEHGALESPAAANPAPAHLLLAQADADEEPSDSDGQEAAPAMPPVTYTAAQAARGEKSFRKNCVECHGENLKGGLIGGPPLKGVSFEAKYANGAPAGVMFEIMSTLMPPDSPGRYSAKTYADIMAYILKENGFKEGAELPADLDTLYTLSVTK